MKMLMLIGGFYALLTAEALTVHALSADFTGTWIRDNNKVEGTKSPLPDLTWVITQDGNQLSIKPVGSRKPTPEEIYKFDGTETVTEFTNSNPPYKVTRSARWLNRSEEHTSEL